MQLASFSAAFLNSQAIFQVEQGKLLSYFFYQESTESKRRKTANLFARSQLKFSLLNSYEPCVEVQLLACFPTRCFFFQD